MHKNIVIIGGGYCGVLLAKKLAKRTKKLDVTITVIDKNPFHTMLTELHEVAAGRSDPVSIQIPFSKIFYARNINFHLGFVRSINTKKHVVICNDISISYDYLVIAAGSRPEYFGTVGAKEHSLPLWSYEDAINLRAHIRDCFLSASKTTDPQQRDRLLSFFVVGAGFTGVEMSGELAEFIPFLCEEYDINRQDVKLFCVDILKRVVPSISEKGAEKVTRRLKHMGVEIMLSTNISAISKNSITALCSGEKKMFPTNTVIWAAGTSGVDLDITGSDISINNRCRFDVNSYLRMKGFDNIYVGGDDVYYVHGGKEVPQMVENAEHSAETIATNLYCDLCGIDEYEKYEPEFHGAMISVGSRYGVAEVGKGRKLYRLPSFLAMLCKHFINIVYFMQVAGYNKCASYLKHEFIERKNRRSIFGGHFANISSAVMLVPLRIFLGAYWLIEAIEKIFDGWFKSPSLSSFFGGADQFFNNIVSGGKDAATSATVGVAEAAGEVMFHLNFLDVLEPMFVKSSGEYAFRILFWPVNFFVEKVVLFNDFTQLFFQIFIVVSEIVIGLSLIFGLLTFVSNLYSLGLQAMFLMTTGLYLSTWWMIFASIALLFGAGHSFGLDYYVLPILKRWWSHLPFIRKWYFYND